MTLYDFLNSQSGDRLVGYGVVAIIAILCLTEMVKSIVESLCKKGKPKNENCSL